MNERLVVLHQEAGEVGVTLGDNFKRFFVPVDCVIVYISASPSVDDAGLTLDVNDDGTGVIAGVACATEATPGVWKSKHFGGANDPVRVAAGSNLSLDANNAAANTRLAVDIWVLTGEA